MILSSDFLDVIILWEELGQRISLDDVWENLYCPPLYCTIHWDSLYLSRPSRQAVVYFFYPVYFLSTENACVGYFVANLHTFRRMFYMPKKCSDVQKLTIIRYVHHSLGLWSWWWFWWWLQERLRDSGRGCRTLREVVKLKFKNISLCDMVASKCERHWGHCIGQYLQFSVLELLLLCFFRAWRLFLLVKFM